MTVKGKWRLLHPALRDSQWQLVLRKLYGVVALDGQRWGRVKVRGTSSEAAPVEVGILGEDCKLAGAGRHGVAVKVDEGDAGVI